MPCLCYFYVPLHSSTTNFNGNIYLFFVLCIFKELFCSAGCFFLFAREKWKERIPVRCASSSMTYKSYSVVKHYNFVVVGQNSYQVAKKEFLLWTNRIVAGYSSSVIVFLFFILLVQKCNKMLRKREESVDEKVPTLTWLLMPYINCGIGHFRSFWFIMGKLD